MTIDDKTRTELEAAVFRRLVDHLRARTDVQNIDLMNLAGFCRNCLSNWMKEAADAKGVAVSKDESREAVYGMPYEEMEGETSGHGHAGATRPRQKVHPGNWASMVSQPGSAKRQPGKPLAPSRMSLRSSGLQFFIPGYIYLPVGALWMSVMLP